MAGAGDLDRRIVIERGTAVRDDFNNEVTTWAPLMEVWASFRAASAREQLASQEEGAEVDGVFVIRWSTMAATIDPKDRLIFDGRTYDIVEATQLGRRNRILIKATTRSD